MRFIFAVDLAQIRFDFVVYRPHLLAIARRRIFKGRLYVIYKFILHLSKPFDQFFRDIEKG